MLEQFENYAIPDQPGVWIETEKELPEKDGMYEVTNDPYNLDLIMRHDNLDLIMHHEIGVAFYDGYGFKYLGIYRYPKYWRKYEFKEKRYGKISWSLQFQETPFQKRDIDLWFEMGLSSNTINNRKKRIT